MKAPKKHLIVPICILFFMCSFTAYALMQQDSLSEYSLGIMKLLITIIGVIGSGLTATIVYIFSRLSSKVDKMVEKLENINTYGCAAYNNDGVHSQGKKGEYHG